jgi:ankyrin repeat protein
LLLFGADPNKEGWNGSNALAVGAEYPGIVTLLLERSANPNAHHASGCYNPLACAAKAQSIESVRLMIAYGGDASRVDAFGANVLHEALMHSNAECCRELLAHGADPCGRCRINGETPLHVVAEYAFWRDGPERVKVLNLLLEAGASLLVKDGQGATPGYRVRHLRAGRASMEVLKWFSRHEAV